MKQVVVINVSNQDLRIHELRQILPAGSIDERFVLPLDIAVKYKQFLYPVAVIDPEYEIRDMSTVNNEFRIQSPDVITEAPRFDLNELSIVKKSKPLEGKKISKKKRKIISTDVKITKRKNSVKKKQEIDENGQNSNTGTDENLYQDDVGCSDN